MPMRRRRGRCDNLYDRSHVAQASRLCGLNEILQCPDTSRAPIADLPENWNDLC